MWDFETEPEFQAKLDWMRAEWVINGHKWFSTDASSADIVLVYAETDREQRPHRHVSMFVVEAGTAGMDIVRDIPTMAGSNRVVQSRSASRRRCWPHKPSAPAGRVQRSPDRVTASHVDAGSADTPRAGMVERSMALTSPPR